MSGALRAFSRLKSASIMEIRVRVPRLQYALLAGTLALSAGCKGSASAPPAAAIAEATGARPIGAVVQIKSPLGLPPVLFPANNPPTAQTIALGRRLFYDTRLSKNDTVSCAFCHNPNMAFSDGRTVAVGVGGSLGVRNSPTLLNSAYSLTQFWDGREPDLEKAGGRPPLPTRWK